MLGRLVECRNENLSLRHSADTGKMNPGEVRRRLIVLLDRVQRLERELARKRFEWILSRIDPLIELEKDEAEKRRRSPSPEPESQPAREPRWDPHSGLPPHRCTKCGGTELEYLSLYNLWECKTDWCGELSGIQIALEWRPLE